MYMWTYNVCNTLNLLHRITPGRFMLWCWQKKDTRKAKRLTDKHIRGAFNKIQVFFVQAFKIVVCYFYTSYEMTDQIFMISDSKEQLQFQLEYTLLKPDCHSWWISKIQCGREDTLDEGNAIKFCFELGKNAAKTYAMLQTAFGASCMNRA